jgi:hypothetical protein
MPKLRPRHFRIALLCCAIAATSFAQGAPAFKVDPSWPLDMPNHWIMGAVTGVFVDARQHVWVTHLPETLTEEELYEEPWNVAGLDPAKPKPVQMATCCKAAPPVLEFDQQGKLVQGWGQCPMTDFSYWPREPHGIFVDHKLRLGRSYNHHRVMKFTRDGKHLMTLGEYRDRQRRRASPWRTVGHLVDPKTNGLRLGRLPQPPRDRVRRRDRKMRATGALTATCPTTPSASIRRRGGRRARSSSHTAASPDRTTARSRRRSPRNRIRCSTTRASSSPKSHRAGDAVAGSAFVPMLSPDAQQQWLYVADGTNHKV